MAIELSLSDTVVKGSFTAVPVVVRWPSWSCNVLAVIWLSLAASDQLPYWLWLSEASSEGYKWQSHGLRTLQDRNCELVAGCPNCDPVTAAHMATAAFIRIIIKFPLLSSTVTSKDRRTFGGSMRNAYNLKKRGWGNGVILSKNVQFRALFVPVGAQITATWVQSCSLSEWFTHKMISNVSPWRLFFTPPLTSHSQFFFHGRSE